jgi:hypothetical protein
MILQVEYLWESLDGWAAIPRGYNLKSLVLSAPVQAVAGRTYRLRLTSKFSGSQLSATAEVRSGGSPRRATHMGRCQAAHVCTCYLHQLILLLPPGDSNGDWISSGRAPAWPIR